jgi:multiple sugar transport system permease protein
VTTVVDAKPVQTTRPSAGGRRSRRWLGLLAEIFMIVATVLWILPIGFALYVALRRYSETSRYGYVSLPHQLTFENFANAWTQSDMLRFFLNSIWITVPAVVLTLMLASAVAFIVSRVNLRLNVALHVLFAAGNLLPQQVIITPLYRLYLQIHLPHFLSGSGLLYNSIAGLVVINVSFQLGFCVFVLSNYMKTIPHEMYEALVDGASLWTRFWKLTLPLSRPALAALATLLTTWIYNDFFWAITAGLTLGTTKG